ncbi:MAG: formylglycine-generating enzyme family protein [Gemmataceae bacterium]
MRQFTPTRLGYIFLFFTVTVTLLSCDPRMPDDLSKQPVDTRVTDLIEKLGDNRYINRVKAGQRLLTLGEAALPGLRKATKHNDKEVRDRAEQIIGQIMARASTSKSTGLQMVLIESGAFRMGSPLSERGRQSEETQHQVAITKQLLIGKLEVTQKQFQQVMKRNPSWFSKNGGGKQQVRGTATNEFPVENVTWYDALEFCNRLSRLDGYPPYYKLEAITRKDNSIVKANVTIVGGSGYRLPTEAEWEYACRATTTNKFHYGVRTQKNQANVKAVLRRGAYVIKTGGPSLGRPTTTGTYPKNPWGLQDMHGNIAEWCWDYHDRNYYTRSPAKDPKGPLTGNHRVVRGGSWLVFEDSCRSASRFWMSPSQNTYSIGFRVVRNPG